MSYLDKIKDKAADIAKAQSAPSVEPRHILLAIIETGGEGVEILENEGVDTSALAEVIHKYGKGDCVSFSGLSKPSSSLLESARGIGTHHGADPGPETLLLALIQSRDFIEDELIAAIGIDWDEIGQNLRRRMGTRHFSNPIWSHALMSDPGLHRANIHKNFSDDVKNILKQTFEDTATRGGGSLDIGDILLALLDSDTSGEIRAILTGAGFDVEGFRENLASQGGAIEPILLSNSVSFNDALIDAFVEAGVQRQAFPAEQVERHHLLLGLARVGEGVHPEMFREYAETPYGAYQHIALELIHIRRGTPKLDLATTPDPEVLKLLTSQQVEEFRALPVRITDGKLVVASPGYLSPHIVERIEHIVRMKISPHLAPAGWMREYSSHRHTE